ARARARARPARGRARALAAGLRSAAPRAPPNRPPPPPRRRVARPPARGTWPEPGKQFERAVDRHVPHAGRIDPLANGVVVLAARVVELPTLDVDRLFREDGGVAPVVV